MLILKNTTGSDIFVTEPSQNLPANSSRTINPTVYRHYTEAIYDNAAFLASVTNGNIVVNVDGGDLSAANGIRYLQTFNLRDSINSLSGQLYSVQFTDDNPSNNSWLELSHNGLTCDETPYLLPFDSKLVAITISSEDDGQNYDIEFWKIPFQGNASTLVFTQQTNNTRFITNRSISNANITFNAGDKVGVFSDSDHYNINVQMWFQVINTATTDLFDNTSTQIDDD